MTYRTIFLVFPSEREAVRTFKKLGWIPDATEFLPAVGWMSDGASVAFDPLFKEGIYWQKTGKKDAGGNEIVREKSGYHLNIAWIDALPLPEQLKKFQVFPKTPACVFSGIPY